MTATDALELLVLALATSAISVTITQSDIFSGLRASVANRSRWLGVLVRCPYCTSHWVSVVLMWWYGQRIVPETYLPIDLFVSALAIVAVASFFTFLVMLAYKYAHTSRNEEELRDLLAKARDVIVRQQSRLRELEK